MGKRTIYLHEVEFTAKKKKSMIKGQTEIVSVCKTTTEMNNTNRVIDRLKADYFGQKSVAYKTDRNFWITKIISSLPISESFYYTDKNYHGGKEKI